MQVVTGMVALTGLTGHAAGTLSPFFQDLDPDEILLLFPVAADRPPHICSFGQANRAVCCYNAIKKPETLRRREEVGF